jgi:hypothetical protein
VVPVFLGPQVAQNNAYTSLIQPSLPVLDETNTWRQLNTFSIALNTITQSQNIPQICENKMLEIKTQLDSWAARNGFSAV